MERSAEDTNANGSNTMPIFSNDSATAPEFVDGEENSELKALLPPKGSPMSRKAEKKGRKVRWNDTNGDKLAEVLEFQPSEQSESEDEKEDSCICTIM